LFARAIRLVFGIAYNVGITPEYPTTDVRRMSAPSDAISDNADSPEKKTVRGYFFLIESKTSKSTEPSDANSGEYFRICSSSVLIFEEQLKAFTLNLSGKESITRKAEEPIDPVEPSMLTVFN